MSANNWGICPKCSQQKYEALEKVKNLYGKVSADEYNQLLDDAKDLGDVQETTLREDYEIGIYQSKFFIRYRGECKACRYTKTYKYEEKVP